jgi:hypothetical protein
LPARDRSQLYQVKNRKQSKLVKGRGRRREHDKGILQSL